MGDRPRGHVCPYCYTDLAAGVAQRWEFTLPLEPPSQNVVASNSGSWVKRKRYAEIRDTYIILLRNQKQLLLIPDATKLRRVIVWRLYSGRGQARDRANIVGGCKPLLDAMHRVNLLVDDKEEFVQDFYHQLRTTASGVSITIEELA